MNRRGVLALLAGAMIVTRITRAQQPGQVYRLAIMSALRRDDPVYLAFFDELRRTGFVDGENLVVDGRFLVRDEDAAPLAEALLAGKPDLILTAGDPRTRAVQHTTQGIPILTIADDVLRHGLVDSLSHPRGNTTGISILATEIDGKRQELLIELVPEARHIAALVDPDITPPTALRELQSAAEARGITLFIHSAARPQEIAGAIDAAHEVGAQALNVLAAPSLNANRTVIIERTAALRIPAIYQWPETAEAGGLIAYGPRFTEVFRQVARQAVKIFNGAKPVDIPVEQPTRFELVVNHGRSANGRSRAVSRSTLVKSRASGVRREQPLRFS